MESQTEEGNGASSRTWKSSSIDIYLRLRPSSDLNNRIKLDLTDSRVEFLVPRDAAAGCAACPHAQACTVFVTQSPFSYMPTRQI